MSKDDFISGYCARSNAEWVEVSRFLVALPCNCGDESCHGWAMVSNNPVDITLHNDRNPPNAKPKRRLFSEIAAGFAALQAMREPIPEGAMRVAPGSDAVVWRVNADHCGEL